MNAKQRRLRRQQLDAQRETQSKIEVPATPRGGWVRAIREALGMTLEAFGARLNVSRQTAYQLEKSERLESITIKRLRAASEALGCDLVIYLRPKRSLEDMVQEGAHVAARDLVARTGHSMAMEDQGISDSHLERLIEETASELVERGDGRIWLSK